MLLTGMGVFHAPVIFLGMSTSYLMRAGLILDPYSRFQDEEQQWTAKDDCSYTKNFTLDENFVAVNRSVALVIDGLDTAADICMNGQKISSVANQHVHYALPITPNIGLNTVCIRFESSLAYSAAQAAA
jgi:beta-mannosidase